MTYTHMDIVIILKNTILHYMIYHDKIKKVNTYEKFIEEYSRFKIPKNRIDEYTKAYQEVIKNSILVYDQNINGIMTIFRKEKIIILCKNNEIGIVLFDNFIKDNPHQKDNFVLGGLGIFTFMGE